MTKTEDPVWLEPSTPGLQVKHSTTEPQKIEGKEANPGYKPFLLLP